MRVSCKFGYVALGSVMLLAACQTADKAGPAQTPVAAKDSKIPATGAWKDFYSDARAANIPYDIRVFVVRTQACGHFSGEPPYNAERRAFLNKMIDENCTGLPGRNAALRTRYMGDASLLGVISEVWEIMGEAETVP